MIKIFINAFAQTLNGVLYGNLFYLRARHVKVTAAIQLLQHDLHIYCTVRAPRNIHGIPDPDEGKGYIDALNPQQGICHARGRSTVRRIHPVRFGAGGDRN